MLLIPQSISAVNTKELFRDTGVDLRAICYHLGLSPTTMVNLSTNARAPSSRLFFLFSGEIARTTHDPDTVTTILSCADGTASIEDVQNLLSRARSINLGFMEHLLKTYRLRETAIS